MSSFEEIAGQLETSFHDLQVKRDELARQIASSRSESKKIAK